MRGLKNPAGRLALITLYLPAAMQYNARLIVRQTQQAAYVSSIGLFPQTLQI
jgi:hypothetical protein